MRIKKFSYLVIFCGGLFLFVDLCHAQDILEISIKNQLDNTSNLYLNDSDTNTINQVYLNIINRSGNKITINAPESTTPLSDNYKVALGIPGNILANSADNPVTENSANWTGVWDDEYQIIYLVNNQEIELASDDNLTIQLSNLVVKNTTDLAIYPFTVDYKDFTYADKPYNGQSTYSITIAKNDLQMMPPLRADFVDGNSILNNGHDNNPLTLRITNISTDDTVEFSKDTQIIASFDIQQQQEQPWSLTSSDKVESISITPSDSNFTINFNDETATPTWKITTPSGYSLLPGQHVEFQINDIVTTLPSGMTKSYLKLLNVPGYSESNFEPVIKKTPLLIQDIYDVNDSISSTFIGPRKGQDFAISFLPDTDESAGVVATGGKSSLIKLSASVVNTGSGVITGVVYDYSASQQMMTGGGKSVWHVDSISDGYYRLTWDDSFIAPILNTSTSTPKYLQIDYPATQSSIPAANVYDGKKRSINSNGIFLKNNEVLYAVHDVNGQSNSINFYIDELGGNKFKKASNWLIIAIVNGDDSTVKLGTGTILSGNSSNAKGNAIPSGVIMMWYRGDIPVGWALCDGTNGTPDLQGRFIVGVGPYQYDSENTHYEEHQTGGYNSITLKLEQLPAHTHGGAGDHKHDAIYHDNADDAHQVKWGDGDGNGTSFIDSTNSKNNPSENGYGQLYTSNGGGHEHHSVGHGESIENRPPYYALRFIMKM